MLISPKVWSGTAFGCKRDSGVGIPLILRLTEDASNGRQARRFAFFSALSLSLSLSLSRLDAVSLHAPLLTHFADLKEGA